MLKEKNTHQPENLDLEVDDAMCQDFVDASSEQKDMNAIFGFIREETVPEKTSCALISHFTMKKSDS